MHTTIEHIIQKHGTAKEAVIPILQAIQKEFNYLPEEALEMVCGLTEITPAEIVGVASFYSQFRFKPAGKHMVKVCVGTACHVKGADLVYDSLKRVLKLEGGNDTDADGVFTLEKVSCLGCCSLAPAVQIDNVTYGHVTPGTSKTILEDFIERNNKGVRKDKTIVNADNLQGEVRIGLGSCCIASGSEEIRQAVEETVSKDALNINIKHVGCVGMCHQVPLIEVVEPEKPTRLYAKVQPGDIRYILEKHFRPKGFFKKLKTRL
jgi:NADH-quinone oxidoreductase subunit F